MTVCGVTVWVTHAFRKDGQDIGGTIVPPASKSNHLVGHAIDMNLDTPRNAYQIPLFRLYKSS